jgi:hypothetical protein
MRPPATALATGITILEPRDGASVAFRPIIIGTISDSSAIPAWLIVHAAGSPDFVVASAINIRNDGMWICQPCVGRGATVSGVVFELRAVAVPKEPLTTGMTLDGWPAARLVSPITTAHRL